MYRGKDPGVNFINNLQAAFAHADPKSAKRLTTWLPFCTFGICTCKSCSKMVLTPEDQVTKMYFCGISKIFLLHICHISVNVPKFYWHKTSVFKVSISPTFMGSFLRKFFGSAFLSLNIVFVSNCQKNVHFTNIYSSAFVYNSVFCSFSVFADSFCNLLVKENCQKSQL